MSYKKYYVYKEQVSYDGGQTWDYTGNEKPSGDSIGEYSTEAECEEYELLFRWVNMDATTDYYCVGTTKYYKQKKQVSYDEGQTWSDVIPAEYQIGSVAAQESMDCGYIPLSSIRLFQTYNDGKTRELGCSNNSLYPEDVKPSSYPYTKMITAFIGDCTKNVMPSAFENCTNLETLIIGKNVEYFGQAAFSGCTKLKSVVIPDSTTDIGGSTFRGCTALSSVTIGSGAIQTGPLTFSGCTSLSRVNSDVDGECNIPNNITHIGIASFEGCYSLTSVNIPDSVIYIGGSFKKCISLTSCTIGSGVTTILGSTFEDCYSLNSLIIQSDITSIPNKMCAGCASLTSIGLKGSGASFEIPNSVTDIGNSAFTECSSLTSVTLPYGVTSFGSSCFANCYSLTNVVLPNGFEYIPFEGFKNCRNLRSITLPNSIKEIGLDSFDGCTNLTSVICLATTPPDLDNAFDASLPHIYVPCESVNVYKSSQDWEWLADLIYPLEICERYRWINMDANTDYYCEGPIKYYKQKRQVSYDEEQTWLDVVPAEYRKGSVAEELSEDCGYDPTKKLVVTYTDGRTRIVECNDNTTLTRDETNPDDYESSAATAADIGSCVESIGSYAFSFFNNLTMMYIPNTVTSIGNSAFGYCSNLTSVNIQGGSIGDNAFWNCKKLISVTMGSGVTSIGNYAFQECDNLTSVAIPNSVTRIGTQAFEVCSGLTSIDIPDSVTSIGDRAFYGCTSLTSVTIGNSVTSIGDNAFQNCRTLTSVTVLATTPPTLGTDALYNTNGCPIYVPCESVGLYKSASGWNTYADRIHGIQPCYSYRWVNLDASVDYYCEGTTKYYKQKKQVSHDDGDTWEDVIPYEYQRGDVAETESTDCGYVPPIPKLYVNYSDGTTRKVDCNDSPVLTTGETKPSGYQATAMTEAVIGDCVETIGGAAFYGCRGLIGITIPDSVTTISYRAFSGCTSLTGITIPTGVTSIGYNAFDGCTNLTSIIIPDSVTSIDEGAFSGCTSLTSITIGTGTTSIGVQAFKKCRRLTSVTIPDSVTSIGDEAFNECSGLTSVTIGSGITSIGSYGFGYCKSLTSVTVLATTPPTLTTNSLYSTNNCPIYVPASSVDVYKSASGWSYYASRIRPIS